MRHKKSRKYRIEFLLFILGIIGLIIFKVLDNKENREISKNQAFAIGVLTDFNPPKAYVSWVPNAKQLSINSPKVKFTYSVNDTLFSGNYGSETYPIKDEMAIVGKKYLVAFNRNNHEKGRILLDYPINDSADFKSMVKAFTINPARFKVK